MSTFSSLASPFKWLDGHKIWPTSAKACPSNSREQVSTSGSGPSVPHCFAIQEIFSLICSHLLTEPGSEYETWWDSPGGCGRYELAALARTCKTLSETALDVLWRDQGGGILAVCAILPQFELHPQRVENNLSYVSAIPILPGFGIQLRCRPSLK